jgi:hypothetical protein
MISLSSLFAAIRLPINFSVNLGCVKPRRLFYSIDYMFITLTTLTRMLLEFCRCQLGIQNGG